VGVYPTGELRRLEGTAGEVGVVSTWSTETGLRSPPLRSADLAGKASSKRLKTTGRQGSASSFISSSWKANVGRFPSFFASEFRTRGRLGSSRFGSSFFESSGRTRVRLDFFRLPPSLLSLLLPLGWPALRLGDLSPQCAPDGGSSLGRPSDGGGSEAAIAMSQCSNIVGLSLISTAMANAQCGACADKNCVPGVRNEDMKLTFDRGRSFRAQLHLRCGGAFEVVTHRTSLNAECRFTGAPSDPQWHSPAG
jgi:hypothetical protein